MYTTPIPVANSSAKSDNNERWNGLLQADVPMHGVQLQNTNTSVAVARWIVEPKIATAVPNRDKVFQCRRHRARQRAT